MSSRISRRQFLATAGTLPLAARIFAAHADVPVGLELYSVRDFLAKDLMGTVKAVANQGYQVVEFYSPYYDWTPQTAKEIRSLLDGLGVKCNSTHNSSNVFTPDGIKKAIDLNQAIGSKYIVMASPGEVKNADSWKAVADRLNAASETLKPAGMAAGYHNHGAEWHPVDGKRPMDILASNTSHDVVLQFDIGTCVEAGADPVAWINANPGRIKSMHCKDWAAGGRGYAALFGEGDAPWAKIFEAAEKTGGIEYYLVEQEAGPADEQLQRSEKCLANFKKLKV
jgi:sugar phosphate isomerase/epimerase